VRANRRARYTRLTLLVIMPLIALIAGAYVYATGGRQAPAAQPIVAD
jgi:hypothetical protein